MLTYSRTVRNLYNNNKPLPDELDRQDTISERNDKNFTSQQL